MSLDVMKQALDALESNPDAMVDRGDGHWDFKRDLAITALRAAIEQAQEPVAWISEGGDVSRSKRYMDEMGFKCNPLYTAPRQWHGLTEQEIKDCEKQAMVNGALPFEQRSFFARALEAKLKEKNT